MQNNDFTATPVSKKLTYKTEAEMHWSGKAGDAWQERNGSDIVIAPKLAFYSRMLNKTSNIRSVLEFGPGAGQSMLAVKALLPGISCCAVEINAKSAEALKASLPDCEVVVGSILDVALTDTFDFVYTSGLLIHIADEYIGVAYDRLYNCSKRYIGIAEYYNPTPVEVIYREKAGILFKRDFAGEMLDRYPDLALVDYGFVYHRDHNFPQDDINWFLLEKR